MVISSRTPEGESDHCPVCGKFLIIEASWPFGDAPCPYCGCLLWFLGKGSGIRFFEQHEFAEIRESLVNVLKDRLGWEEKKILAFLSDPSKSSDEIGADSLDVVEAIMEIEGELGIEIGD